MFCHGHQASAYEDNEYFDLEKYSSTYLHRRRVVPLRPLRVAASAGPHFANTTIPDVHDVVVTTASEQLSIPTPGQAADFTIVTQ